MLRLVGTKLPVRHGHNYDSKRQSLDTDLISSDHLCQSIAHGYFEFSFVRRVASGPIVTVVLLQTFHLKQGVMTLLTQFALKYKSTVPKDW